MNDAPDTGQTSTGHACIQGYLKTLAEIGELLSREPVHQQLLEAHTQGEVLEILSTST